MSSEQARASKRERQRRSRTKAKLFSLPSQPKQKRVPLPSQPKLKRVPSPGVHEEHKNDQRPKQITPAEKDSESDEGELWNPYERFEPIRLPREPEEPKNDWPTTITPSERDLESDEAMWALYERWCLHHDIKRTVLEMQTRFKNFKKSVKQAHKLNRKFNTCSDCLNRLSDQPDRERKWKSSLAKS